MFVSLTKLSRNSFKNSVLILYFFSHLPPSQGGRYAGFGNTIETKKDDDFFDNTLSSLSTVSNVLLINEPHFENTCFLHMQKQRRRSATR